MGKSTDEFPLLSGLGLYAAEIRGDGNCLFNALSDQIYGDQSRHQEIRAKVIEYMRDNADYYKQFIDVRPGGGIRRNPKRKNAGSFATPVNFTAPTQAEIDRVFENHLQTMARGGTYGDNMEITAFSSTYSIDVKIYQRDFAYMVSGPGVDESERKVAHIAYHTWEHYSSIRNLDGPHSGLPQVRVKVLSPEEELMQRQRLEQSSVVQPWMIDAVSKSLPFVKDRATIKRQLELAKGHVDTAVSRLLDLEERASATSTQETSSIERDPDSDDEALRLPNKRRNRRLSRATKSVMKESEEKRRQLASMLAANDGSQESISSTVSREHSSVPMSPTSRRNRRVILDSEDEDESDEPEPSMAEPGQLAAEAPADRPIRLKLNPPKRPDSPSTPGIPAKVHGRTQQRQVGPQHRRGPTAREKKEMKKAAQKAAKKERQQAASKAAHTQANAKKGLPIITKNKRASPEISGELKTLYI